MGLSLYDFGKKKGKRVCVSATIVRCEETKGELKNRSNVQLQRGNHEQAGGEAGRRIQEHSERLCGRWMKTSERMNGWKDGGINGRYHSSWTELRLTFPSEEFVSVRSLGQTDSSLTCKLELLLIALLHPSGANWKWGRGNQLKGAVNLFKEYLKIQQYFTEINPSPFSLAHSISSETAWPFTVTQLFTPSPPHHHSNLTLARSSLFYHKT